MSHREITATINIDASGKILGIEPSETLKDGDSFSGTVRVREQTCYGVRIPFDLEAAKRGEPLVTRDGTAVRFIGHVAEAHEGHRVVAMIFGNAYPSFFGDDGKYCNRMRGGSADLFMAPKSKRTKYANMYVGGTWGTFEYAYQALIAAKAKATRFVAVPVEVEE